MDVGNPSNVKRIDYLYNKNIESMNDDIKYNYCDEDMTIKNIFDVWEKYNYIIDPHTAVSYNGVINNKSNKNPYYIIISTAIPLKFRNIIFKAINILPELNIQLKQLEKKENLSIPLKNNYDFFVDILNKSVRK